MKHLLSAKKDNYLLYGTVFLYCTFIVLITISSQDTFFVSSRSDLGNLSILSFIIAVLIVAPLIEEFIFRGYFTNSNLLKILSIISLPLFAILINKHFVLYIVILYSAFIIFDYIKNDKINKKVIYICNALIFSIFHYKFSNFSQVEALVLMIAQFASGLFLIWVILNYNIKTSIFVHFVMNILFILPLLISIQFPDNKYCKSDIDQICLEWQKVPSLNAHTIITKPNPYELIASNIVPLNLISKNITSSKAKYVQQIPFQKYDIKIASKDTGLILDEAMIRKILLQSGLILEIKEP